MALTTDEKLKRLHDMEDWDLFKPEQQAFLKDIANNVDPERAYANNYPACRSPRFSAGRVMHYRNIKRALDVIGYEKPKPVYTKQEALENLTYRLRKQGMEDETYIKLLTIYSRMNGWDKPKTEKPDEEASPLEIVLERERKRRNGEEN